MWLRTLTHLLKLRRNDMCRAAARLHRRRRDSNGARPAVECLERRIAPAAGDLDVAFGSGGVTVTDFPGTADAVAVAVQSDGKVIAAGQSRIDGLPETARYTFVRYDTTGQLDATFGTGGAVVTEFAGAIRAMALQSDGKIVVAGTARLGSNRDFLIARLNGDGSLDDGGAHDSTPADQFGAAGFVTIDFDGRSDEVAALAIYPPSAGVLAGKIVVAGSSTTPTFPSTSNMAVARLDRAGWLDTSFSSDGRIRTSFDSDSYAGATGLVLLPSGGIVAAGFTRAIAADSSTFAALAQYRADGNLDTTFGRSGRVSTAFGFLTGAFAIEGIGRQSDGKLVVVTGARGADVGSDWLVARFNSNGSLDDGAAADATSGDHFGSAGLTLANPSGAADYPSDLVVQPDERIVVVGGTTSPIGRGQIVLARYEASGSPSPAFGDRGVVLTDVGQGSGIFPVAAAFDALHGRLAVAGTFATFDYVDERFAVAQYLTTDTGLDLGEPAYGGPIATENFADDRNRYLGGFDTPRDGLHIQSALTGRYEFVAPESVSASTGANVSGPHALRLLPYRNSSSGASYTASVPAAGPDLDENGLPVNGGLLPGEAIDGAAVSVSGVGTVQFIGAYSVKTYATAELGAVVSWRRAFAGQRTVGDDGELLGPILSVRATTDSELFLDNLSLLIGRGNRPPEAHDVHIVVDAASNESASFNPLYNDFDPDHPYEDPTTYLHLDSYTEPEFGTLERAGDELRYVVKPEYADLLVLNDHFSYVARDEYEANDDATIYLRKGNTRPVAEGGILAAEHGAPGPLTGLFHYEDAESDAVRPLVVDQPEHGQVTLTVVAGQVQASYRTLDPWSKEPLDVVLGPDRFTYRLSDGFSESDVVAVEIQVPNEHAPVIFVTNPPYPLPPDDPETPEDENQWPFGTVVQFQDGDNVYLLPSGTIQFFQLLQRKHELETGQAVVYDYQYDPEHDPEPGRNIGGLEFGQTYYVIKLTDTALQLATSRENARDGIALELTSIGSGREHRLIPFDRDDPNRLDHDVAVFFDPAKAVVVSRVPALSVGGDEIHFPLGHGLSSGQAVLYHNGAGRTIRGLIDSGIYYVIVVNDTTIQLASSLAEALAGSAHRLDATVAAPEHTLTPLGEPPIFFDPTFPGVVEANHIRFPIDPALGTGQGVVYQRGAGSTDIGGLTSGATYYIIRLSALTYALAVSREDALAGTALNLNWVVRDQHQLATVELERQVSFGPSLPSIASEGRLAFVENPEVSTGSKVFYHNGGGTSIGGLVDGQAYYVIQQSTLIIQLAASPADAAAGQAIILTGPGAGAEHSLTVAQTRTAEPTPDDRAIVFDPALALIPGHLLTFPGPHGFTTGEEVRYDAAGGAVVGGLADRATYFVIAHDETHVQLALSADDAGQGRPMVLRPSPTGAAQFLTPLGSRLRFDPDAPIVVATGNSPIQNWTLLDVESTPDMGSFALRNADVIMAVDDDTGAAGDFLMPILTRPPQHGDVVFVRDDDDDDDDDDQSFSFTYTPFPGQEVFKTDSFAYQISDGWHVSRYAIGVTIKQALEPDDFFAARNEVMRVNEADDFLDLRSSPFTGAGLLAATTFTSGLPILPYVEHGHFYLQKLNADVLGNDGTVGYMEDASANPFPLDVRYYQIIPMDVPVYAPSWFDGDGPEGAHVYAMKYDFDYPGPGFDETRSSRTAQLLLTVLATDVFGQARAHSDYDGLSDDTEGQVPGHHGAAAGDGNGDGVADAEQSHVASFRVGDQYVTLAAAPGMPLINVHGEEDLPAPPPDARLPIGTLAFELVANATKAKVTLFPPAGVLLNSYYKFGPTSENVTPHWYEFVFDETTGTGAKFNQVDVDGDGFVDRTDSVDLYFVDAKRGDDRLDFFDGIIDDPGAPAFALRTPAIDGVVLNDGIALNSKLNKITVSFNEAVTLGPGAFAIRTQRGTLLQPNVRNLARNGKSVVELTFGGSTALPAGSYQLTIDASQVHQHGSDQALDGDRDGSPGGNYVLVFSSSEYLDSDGDRYTVRLSGPGQALVVQDDSDLDGRGPISKLTLQGTDPAKTTLTITVKKAKTGDGRITMRDVAGTGLKSFTAAAVDLSGGLFSLTGFLGTFTIGDIRNGADITLPAGTAKQATTITAHVVGDDSDITVGAPINTFSAAAMGDGKLTAPVLAALSIKGDAKAKIRGDFLADLNLTGPAVAGKPALGSATIGGNIADALWTVAGDIGKLTVNGSTTSWNLDADAINQSAALADVVQAKITVDRQLKSLSATTFINSFLFAGFQPADPLNPMLGGVFTAAGRVDSFKINGKKNLTTPAYAGSTVAAARIGTVSLLSVDADNAGTLFGVLVDLAIGSVKIKSPAFAFDKTKPTPQSKDNFQVRII